MQMNIAPIYKWHPLLCPQDIFVDKHNEFNAYIETNPALWIEADTGECIALVRLINYRKFKNRAFKIGSSHSNSKYYIYRGYIHPTNGNFVWKSGSPLIINNHFKKYFSVWRGHEDIRFLTATRLLITSPENNTSGKPRLVLGVLIENEVVVTRLLEPSEIEKNWMSYFSPDKQPMVIYNVSPFSIKPLMDGIPVILAPIEELEGYHGSTNGVCIGYNEWIFIIHKFTDKTEHRWICVNFEEKSISYSDPFVFHSSSYIEFTCSLAIYNSMVYIGLGINDDKAFIVSMPYSNIHTSHHSKFT